MIFAPLNNFAPLNRRPFGSIAFAFAALLFAAVVSGPAPACPMCKSQLSPDEELARFASTVEERRASGAIAQEEAAALLSQAERAAEVRVGQTRGFAYSIYLMLVAPTLIFGALAGVVVVAAREGVRRQRELGLLPRDGEE